MRKCLPRQAAGALYTLSAYRDMNLVAYGEYGRLLKMFGTSHTLQRQLLH